MIYRLLGLLLVLFSLLGGSEVEASYHRNLIEPSHSASTQKAAFSPVRTEVHSWKSSVGTLSTYAKVHTAQNVRGGITYPADPITIGYLLHRRELNPARFDFYHHHLGKLLARDERLRAAGPNCTPMQGLISNTPFHRYLRWRRSLNPSRFDYYHHTLGALLGEDQRLRNLPLCLPGGVMPPGPVGGGPGAGAPGAGPGTGGGGPPAVPEPGGAFLLTLGGCLIAATRLRRRRRIA